MRRTDVGLLCLVITLFTTAGCDGNGTGGGAPGPDASADAAMDAVTVDTALADVVADVEAGAVADVAAETTDDAGGEDATSDSDADTVELPAHHPFFDFVGEVRLEQSNTADGAFQSAGGMAWFWDGPDGFYTDLVLLEEEGACQFWVTGLPPFCDPPCDSASEWCGQDGTCHPKRSRLSAGTLTFGGLLQDITAIPDDSAWYDFQGLDNGAPLFEQGAVISVSASGDEVVAFDAEVTGVGSMITPTPGFEFVDGEDNVFEWEVQGDEAVVEVAFLVGWHGAPPPALIWCAAPEADGSLVVPKHMVEMFPTAGCMGLFPHPSWVRRVHRAVVETDAGPVEVVALSRKTFALTHGDCF